MGLKALNDTHFMKCIFVNSKNKAIVTALLASGLTDAWLVGGCLFQTVWNVLTGRDPEFGIKDYDVFYFDDSDLSWEAEDRAIRNAKSALSLIDAQIEFRNQARVHLWYPEKFGVPYDLLTKTTDGVDRFLAIACMVGIRITKSGEFEIYAPNGFKDLEKMIIRPNNAFQLDRNSYLAKTERWQAVWPELKVDRL